MKKLLINLPELLPIEVDEGSERDLFTEGVWGSISSIEW